MASTACAAQEPAPMNGDCVCINTTAGLVQSIYKRLSPEAAGYRLPRDSHALGALVSECDSLLAFREAEHAADRKAADMTENELRAACDALAASMQTVSVDDATQLNYLLALDAFEHVQGELNTMRERTGDTTVVTAPESRNIDAEIAAAVESAAASLRAEHASELEAAKSAHSAHIERIHAEYAAASEAMRAVHAEEMRSSEDAHAAALAQTHATHARELNELRDTHTRDVEEIFSSQASQAGELRTLRAQVSEAEGRVAAERKRAAVLDADLAAAHTGFAHASNALVRRCAALDTQLSSAEAAVSALAAVIPRISDRAVRASGAAEAAAEGHLSALRAQHATESEVQRLGVALAGATDELNGAQARLDVAESTLRARHSALITAQTELERAADLQSSLDEARQRTAAAEGEAADMREQLRNTEPLRNEAARLSGEVRELETLLSMHKSDAARAEAARESAQAAADDAGARVLALEHKLAERADEIEGIRDSKRRLAEQVRALRAERTELAERVERAERAEPAAGGSDALADYAARIEQLETVLAARAQEVEESDTRMLEVLRENKRLSAKLRALSSVPRVAGNHVRSEDEAPRAVRAVVAGKGSPERQDRGAFSDRTNTPTRQRTEQKRAPENAFRDRLARFKAAP